MAPSAYYPMDRLAASVPAARETSSTSELARRVKEASAAQQHDVARDAFGDLVDLLQRRAVCLAYVYLRNADDADDVVQDAFVKAFARIGDYRTEQPFDPWFLKILVNQCLDRLKARDRRARWMSSRSDDDDWQIEAVDGAPTAEDRLVHAEQASRLWEAISALPARQRTVVVLHKRSTARARRRSAPRRASASRRCGCTCPGVEEAESVVGAGRYGGAGVGDELARHVRRGPGRGSLTARP